MIQGTYRTRWKKEMEEGQDRGVSDSDSVDKCLKKRGLTFSLFSLCSQTLALFVLVSVTVPLLTSEQ